MQDREYKRETRVVSQALSAPLSEGQQQLWLLAQRDDNASKAYNVPVVIRLRGELNTSGLCQAIEDVIERHEALRTVISKDGSEQRVLPHIENPTSIVDLTDLPSDNRENQLQSLLQAACRTQFDLARGPLFQATLVKLEDQRHVLALVAHHIIVDGWSMGVLVKDIAAAYTARQQQADFPDTLPAQLREYNEWLATNLDDVSAQKHESYWLEQLAGTLPELELPGAAQRPPRMSFRGARQTVRMDADLVRRLNDLSREEVCTPFMTLLAGYLVLLHRLSGQNDLIVGIPVAKRAMKGGGELVGYCVNLVPIRARMEPGMRFRDFLVQVRQTLLQAYGHAEYPFARLANRLNLPRDLSRPSLVATTFNVNPPATAAVQMPGIELELVRPPIGYTSHDLTVNLIGLGDEFELELEYNTDFLDAATAGRFARYLVTLYENLAADPTQAIATLPMLSNAEREVLLKEWNATSRSYPQDACLHALFEAQAAKTPAAPALVFEGQTLSYAELNTRANQLGHYLRDRGVGPDVPVGVYMERSLEMVIALYGILKAGGAYVPLDPDYPRARLDYILNDTRVPVVLTQGHLRDRLGSCEGQVLCLDSDWARASDAPADNPPREVTPAHLAYVIYTSGSTGQPKGVGVPHRGIVNRLLWMQEAYGLDASDRVLQKTPFSFDVSVWEFFWPLLTGARLVVARPGGHKDSAYLAGLITDAGITTVHFVPPMLAAFLEEPGIAGCRGLRRVICSGEALPVELVKRHYERLGVPLNNLYGPTEAAVDVSYWACDPEADLTSVPIGRPVANTQLYVLDGELQPVPVGVTGELYIGGVQLARGYLHRPDLTAEKFIPHPFSAVPGERLYRTGDLARYREDGNIEFLGRIDHQVKVRGFRIELGEIEAALVQHPTVREAVVIAREDPPGDKRLVAYLTPAGAGAVESTALRVFLKDQLPDYMVPAVFVMLEALPLSPNGKVDRKALPAPDAEAARDAVYVAPRNPSEQTLADIWAELLGVEQVGVHDNFFDLGGHSLLVTQVVSRLRALFEVELPLKALFEAPTLGALAAAVEAARQAEAGVSAPPLVPVDRGGAALPLSFAQQRLWVLDQLKPHDPFYNMPGAVRLQGALDADALRAALNAVIARHENLRTTFATVDGQAVQVIAPVLELSVPLIELTEDTEEAREVRARTLLLEEARRPFDLAAGPLLRVRLIQLAADDHLLQVTLHHIIADGWSLGVFIEELAALYAEQAGGPPAALAPLPVQYADFAHWQRQWLQGEVLDQQLAYWRSQLDGLPARLELPTDHPRPAVQSFKGAHLPITIPPELTHALRRLSREAGVTLFMTLLAAFQVLLARYSGQRDLAVGTPIANRNRAETEGLIGCFINSLVLRADLADDPGFRALLERTKATTLGAYAHQDLPFERLVDALSPERDMSHTPLFQVMFALQNTPVRALELAGLTLTPWALESGTAKFDLTLELTEEGEGLSGTLEYSTDLFEAATIERLAGHYLTLLAGIVQAPEARVSELPLLSDAERRQLLVEWNATATDYPRDRCIHQLFEAQAAQTPAAPAVVFEDQTLSYAELNAKANQLAHYLRSRGVGPDTLVGLCVERSLDMVIGLLGILKAGGAYVPLDPTYPRERLAYMLEDSQAPLLLTQAALLERLPAHAAAVVCLDRDVPQIASHAVTDPVNLTRPAHVAYVIYTSGSTGRPKGTSTVHRNVVRLVRETDYACLDANQIVLQLAPVTFDASTLEIWGSLLNGSCLVVPPPETPSLEDLGRLISTNRVTTLWLTAGLFHLMVDEQIEDLRKVPQLLAGGDVLSAPHLRALLNGSTDRRVINGYGPTENTTFTCCYSMTAEEQIDDNVPIGRPIANTQVYVLDNNLNPVPAGVVGELYTGGDGLARGYLNRPDLTAERFIPHPFSAVPGARLYRTGDLARYRSDGNIEFLGRIDHQVKVRGFRIELGEIEAALTQHPTVREAVVIAREDTPGDKRLVAYLVAQAGGTLEAAALRTFVKETLPDYMLPSAFVVLEALPLTPNGKIDRAALPAPEADAARDEAYVAPRNPTEQTLADIWGELLRVERVGVHDNFFALGGDSILGIQIITRASQAGLALTARQLFEHQTVAELAAVAGTREIIAEQGLVSGPVALTPIQHWFFERDLTVPQHFNQSVLLEVDERLDPGLLSEAIGHVTLHHDALRMRFERSGSTWQQSNGEAANEAGDIVSVVDLSSCSGAERAVALESAGTKLQASLDLGEGPLMGLALFHVGPDQPDRLLIIVHHLVVDGVSWRILVEDLFTVYQQLDAENTVKLPPKTTSFQQWAARLHEYADSQILEAELDYWQELARRPTARLPVDHPGGANQISDRRVVSLSLSPSETRALLQEAPEAYQTQINDLLLTALTQTLTHWAQTDSLRVDLEGHGREPFAEDLDVSRTVGWFTALYPVCLELNNGHEPGTAIKAIKEQLRQVPGKGLGYGVLRYLGREEAREALARMPSPEICFNYLGQFDAVSPHMRLAKEGRGPEHHPNEPGLYLLDISAQVTEGVMTFHWAYSEQLYDVLTIEQLAESYRNNLLALIEHCLSPDAGGYTPSDFDDLDLDQSDLDGLLADYESAQN